MAEPHEMQWGNAPARETLTAEQAEALEPLVKLAAVGNPKVAQQFESMKPGELKRRELKRRVLEALRENGTLTHAAAAVDMPPSTIYRWRKADPEFDAAVTEFLHVDMVDTLEQSAFRIATSTDPKMASAAVKAQEMLLKAYDRDRFGDHQRIEQTTTINHMVQVVHEVRDTHRERQAERLRRLRTLDAEPPPNVKSDILPPSEETP